MQKNLKKLFTLNAKEPEKLLTLNAKEPKKGCSP